MTVRSPRTDELKAAIAKRLKSLRERAGMTQRDAVAELAAHGGPSIDTSQLSHYETGRSRVPADMYVLLLEVYRSEQPR